MLDQLKDVIARTWGFRELRPLQEPAMRAVLDGRKTVRYGQAKVIVTVCADGDTVAILQPLSQRANQLPVFSRRLITNRVGYIQDGSARVDNRIEYLVHGLQNPLSHVHVEIHLLRSFLIHVP